MTSSDAGRLPPKGVYVQLEKVVQGTPKKKRSAPDIGCVSLSLFVRDLGEMS